MSTQTPDVEKQLLHTYLDEQRHSLLWKLEGLSERDLRLPRTSTGTNLIGIVKHALNVEAGYFGDTFGRSWPTPAELVPHDAYEVDPQLDWYATEAETAAGLVDLYRRVQAFADETIAGRPLDAPGRVPWWREGHRDVTLRQIIVHVTAELARHAGHADILREQVDGAAGWLEGETNLPELDWPEYVAKLRRLAESYPG